MRILVLDDNSNHRLSAQSLLKGHDVTIVGTYEEAERLLRPGRFDAFLSDLLLPASKKTLSPDAYQYVGQEMPLGPILALLALKFGVKYVAVLTDTNHHKHPAAAAFDAFWPRRTNPFVLGDAHVLCGDDHFVTRIDEKTGERVSYDFLQTDEGKQKYPETGWQTYQGTVRAKDWVEALDQLIAGPEVPMPTTTAAHT